MTIFKFRLFCLFSCISIRSQVFSSIAYGASGYDFPLLGVSAMSMGRVRVLAIDLQPLFVGDAYAAKYAEAYAAMKDIRDRYPQMGQVGYVLWLTFCLLLV